MANNLILLSGNANKPLAEKISRYLDVPLGKAFIGTFSDGETRVELKTNVRGADVFIIQSTCHPANHNLMEAVIIADACRRASAGRLTLVAPYFGYARQERQNVPRTPITAKLAADIIQAAGFDRIVSLELHAGAIQGFFNIPFDHLFAKPIFENCFKKQDNLLVVSPDAGGTERARALAKNLNCGLAIVDKRRDRPNESEVMNIIGNVEGKNCIIYDDMCDTGGSLTRAGSALMGNGANSVCAAIVHPVFSGPAFERIAESCLSEVITTDTIPIPNYPIEIPAAAGKKIHQISVAEYIGKAIKRIHNNESVSSLF